MCGTDEVTGVKEHHHHHHHQLLRNQTLLHNYITIDDCYLLVLSSLSESSPQLPRAPDTALNLIREPEALDPRFGYLLQTEKRYINSSVKQ